MSFTVTIRGQAETLPVEMGQTILDAALARGVPYPHGCRSGNCGACKSHLHSGEVDLAAHSDYALSAAEKAGGLILACRAVPWSDAEVEWLDQDDTAVHASRRLTCEVAGIEQATHDIRILRLKILSGGPFDFSPGQYAHVTFEGLPGQELPGRDYSMAGRPGDDLLEFHVRLVPGGAVTPFVAERLAVGDRVRVEGPLGTAYLRARHAGPILAVAGGSGLAPVKAIVEAALAAGARQPIRLYLGVRVERDVYLEEHFRALAERHPNLDVTIVLSEPDGPTDRRTGFLADVLAEDFDDLDGTKAYLAGPPIMVETATAALRRLGVRRQDCHADAFYTEADKARLEAS